MVDHAILLSKLEAYNFDNNALLWFKSHITDRTQPVSFMGQSSSVRTITTGVSQGSILGPLLFIVVINELPLLDLFTDHTTLFSNNVQDLENIFLSEVANVDEWATTNKLPLNSSKTKIILIDGQRLKR